MRCILSGVSTGNKCALNCFNSISRDIFRADKSEREIVLSNLAKYIVKHNKTQGHIKYVVGFMFCQVKVAVYIEILPFDITAPVTRF